MTSFGVLYSYVPNARILMILAAARINNLHIDVPTAPDFVFRGSNKTPAFLSRFPLGKVPALALPDGTSIFESDAIAQYVAESGPKFLQLLGTSHLQRAHIRQWICFSENELLGHVYYGLASWRVGRATYDEAKEAKAMAALERTLAVLETVLSSESGGKSGWLVEYLDRKLSLADLSAASALFLGFFHFIGKEIRSMYLNTVEWYLKVVTDASVKEVFGEASLIEARKIGGAA